MGEIIYKVARIDGDYAFLVIPERPELEEKCVARALLPDSIREGSVLKYEMFEYELLEA
ncbi:MAG: DUF3006 domain-containing protein [Lachnospiraceae bacterium]|nr:DUF3006 domain-containing protein [Lachnospiraceae bacterium]